MADKKISDLAAAATLTGADLAEVEQPGEAAGTRSRKVTLALLRAFALTYDNSTSLLVAEDFQAAVDELVGLVDDLQDQVDTLPAAIDPGVYPTLNAQTGTSYTLVLADKGALVTMNNAAANAVTVPPNSTAAFAVGSRVDVGQDGAGQTTIVAGSGVTIRTPETLKLRKQWAKASLIKRDTNTWDLEGNLEAAP